MSISLKTSALKKYITETGKLTAVCLLIFQIFTQPMAAMAQKQGAALQVSQSPNGFKKSVSNIKPKIEESGYDQILPDLENKTRRAVSDALGVEIPLPQVFGENGKLKSLFSGDETEVKNRELIELALNDGKNSDPKSGSANGRKSIGETAISINAPTLNSGSIDGSLRVLKEIPFSLNDDFRISENLYAAGSPSISTSDNSAIKKVINDRGDDSFGEYPVYLSGGKIGGDIYIHSTADNIFEDIPTGLPKPMGSETVEINSADDLKAIKDWKTIKNLTVNAENLTIEIPAGNYEKITLNAPNKIVFAQSVYNFSDTLSLQKGSVIEIAEKATLGIGKNLSLEDVTITTNGKISPEDFKINVLGNSVNLTGKTEITGLLRAMNASVVIGENSGVKGQVIAGSLVMNGGFITRQTSNTANNIAVTKEGFTLDGRIEGSVQQLLAQNTTFNSNAVVTGDLLMPGVPQLTQNGAGTFGGTITGTGTATPTNHRLTLNSNTSLRKLKNRINPATMPTVPTPPASTGTQSVTINNPSQHPTNFSNIRDITMNSGAGVLTLPPGNYRNLSVGSGSGFKLGTAGQTAPVTYNLSSFTVNSNAQIQIVSPVIINLGTGLNLNAPMGVVDNPGWLKLNVASGNVTLNSNSNLYGGVIAPNSIVTINSGTLLIGNVVCKKIVVNSGGILRNVLPNLLSDTSVAITSPANNSTTSNNVVTVTGTAQSSVGIANIFVNEQAAVYNSSNGSWAISNVALALGDNIITARAVDALGTEAVTQILVTRQGQVADTAPPVISISSPANNSTVSSETITVSGNAADPGTNASGLANVKVNGQTATLTAGGNWTISGIALNTGSNTITARATDNAGNYSDAAVTVIRQIPDTTAPTLAITAPANNSETTDATTAVSGTVSDGGDNPSGVASVTVNGQAAAISGGSWSIASVALTIGSNTITVNALDNAGNSSSQQVTVKRTEADTQAPTITISSPANNAETNDATIAVSGTASDQGTNASGVQSVTVNGQAAAFSNGNWSINSISLNVGSNTITVRAIDIAGNEASSSIVVIRREPDTQAPAVSISSPLNNFETLEASITVSGTVVDSGDNSSGVKEVVVNGIAAAITGGIWTAQNVPLNIGSNAITAVAKDNRDNSASVSVTVIRNPPDNQPPTISNISPANNFETFDPQIVVSGTAIDQSAGATGVQSVVVNGITATYNTATNEWSATVNLVDGANTITITATDNAPTPNQSQATIQVTKLSIMPPTLTVTNPPNGAFLSADSVTVAGNVFSNKPDMTFNVSINGQTVNLAGREFTRVIGLTDGANVITVLATDALGQQAQQSVTVTNDRTPPTVFLTNVPQVVNPGESYVIGANAFDTYGISDVEFTLNGASIERSSVSPYQFTLNIPLNQAPNQSLNISAIARDNAGLSATATARIVTSGPSGLTGYVFDDATGYVIQGAISRLNSQNPVLTDENGLYRFVSSGSNGNIVLWKDGYTAVERSYAATAGSGVEVFDARLTPLDTKANVADANGSANASDAANKIQAQFAAGSFSSGANIRLTSVSPQGLANLLPFGWSPIPGAVVEIRTANENGFSNRNFPNPANLVITEVPGLASNLPIVLARYSETSHKWIVLQKDLFAGENGSLQANVSSTGQFAFLIADSGASAPPSATIGQELPSSAAANSEQLNSATASASASPATALYSSNAKSRINFIATSASKLPSGIAIEANFNDSYLTVIDRNLIFIERPSQDFVLYSYPSATNDEPNKLSAYFVAKPIRTDFGLSDLLNAKIRVDIRSGRVSQTGILIGQSGGIVRGEEGSELEIPSGSVGSSQAVFFNKIPNDQTGIILPTDYEIVGAFDLNLSGTVLSQSGKISMSAMSGDYSKLVVAKIISISGQPGLKIVARAVENNSRFESTVSQPAVPAGVNLTGIRDSGKYLFVKMPGEFGYIKGTASSQAQNTQSIKISNTQTPFVDLIANNATFILPGLANSSNIQVDAVSLSNDATGYAATSLAAQDSIVNLPISLASATLSVQTVTPANAANNVVVTTPITITFNKPVLSSTVTGSNVRLVTASGNPVITTTTMSAGGRSVILTPSSSLQSETDYRVKVSTGVRDIYGNALANNFESSFRTTNLITIANQLQPSQIRISYPDEQGVSIISIPAGAVPSGSLIIVINNTSGNTVSTIAGSGALQISIPARVGDEIELIIRQPDGSEYRVKQAAYRRADGFVSVGSNGGAVTSEDGSLVLQVPAGAISGQADIKMTFAPESSITAPREGEMAPGEMNYIGGVKIETQGNFTNTEELHLELPAPANVPEGQRALVMQPKTVNVNGNQIQSWETITSAKVESGKIKTTSPPFYGVTLVGTLLSVMLHSFYIYVPARQRVVTGIVRKQRSNGGYEVVEGAICSVRTPNDSQNPTTFATSQRFGTFTISHNSTYYPNNAEVPVTCVHSGQAQYALAYPHVASEPGVSGFEVRFANVIFPADSPVNLPPQIIMKGETLDANDDPLPEVNDSLKLYGKVQAGSKVRVKLKTLPADAVLVSAELNINGSSEDVTFDYRDPTDGFPRSLNVTTTVAGRYSIIIKARTVPTNPQTESVTAYNFIVLSNPNNRPPVSGVNPAVVSVTPIDGATQIDVGASLHVEFSEPVKNLSDQTVYLTEEVSEGSSQPVSGRILSGGIPVTASDARSVIDFVPNSRLKSGKNYKLYVTSAVIDMNQGDPTAVPPVPADPDNQRYLDQDASTPGLQEFSSKFKTFAGAVVTPTPINAQGYKIGVLDDFVITTNPMLNGIASSGMLNVYDATEFIGAENSQNLQPVDSLYIPHVPINLAVKKQYFIVDGAEKELNLIAVTTLSMDSERPRNVWFYNIDENNQIRLVGVVSLTPNANSGQVPNSISIERGRAYIGSSSNGGVYVVDIQQAISAFRAANDTPDNGNDYDSDAVIRAVLPSTDPRGGGFAVGAVMQRAPYDNGYFIVDNISTITQEQKPFAYVASSKSKLIGFDFNITRDGRIGYAAGGEDGKDVRVKVDESPLPVSGFYDVEAVGEIWLEGETKSIAVGVANSLWIFDVTDPSDPVQYPKQQNPNLPPLPAKTFAELGVPVEIGITGKQIEIEGTLAYVMFDNGIGVFDITNPNDPYLSASIGGLPGLRRFAVKDGFIYSLGSNGLNVSIGRGVAQVVTYGYDPTAPDDVCGNPVVISKADNKMMQPAGIFFQLFGQDTPRLAQVIIRKVEISGTTRNETVLATIDVDPENLRTVTNPANGFNVVTGNTFWRDDEIEIDESFTYTAEVVINSGDFRSKQVEIPFSHLLPDALFQKVITTEKIIPANNSISEDVGSMSYVIAGNAVDVSFKVDGSEKPLYNSLLSPREQRPSTRSFGANADFVVAGSLGRGLYPFTFKAKLKANPAYSEEVTGIFKVGEISDDVREPGSTVVAGVEVNSGSLALSETDVSIKGRGPSLEFTRSYNSHAADQFGTLGYGWSHNYQIALIRYPGGYRMIGGEGGGQQFKESNLVNGSIRAEAPYLGRLVKNADGSLDYFTKSQTRYHFRHPVDQGSASVYLGNLEYIEDLHKNRITLSYDTFGRVSTVTDSSARRLNFEYEGAENVFTGLNVGDVIQGAQGCLKVNRFRQITRRLEQSLTGKAWRIKKITGTYVGGLTLEYEYDEKGNLSAVRRDGYDATDSDTTPSREWKYKYNPVAGSSGNNARYDHLLKSVKSPNNADTAVTEYRYLLNPTAPPRVQEILMPEGVSNSFTYDYDQLTNIVNSATFTDGNSNQTAYALTQGRVHTITAPLGAVTNLEWTDFGQIKKTVDPEGKTTEIIFDANNNPSTQTQTGSDGFLIQTVTTFDTKFSKMSGFRDGNGNQTTYEINQTNGNVENITLPTGRKVTFSHFPNGDMRTTTDQYGTVTEFSNYDSYGNARTVTKNLAGGATQVINQTFDTRSRQRSKSDSLGTNETMDYDAFDRVVRQTTTDPAGYRNSFRVETKYLPEGQVSLVVQKDNGAEISRIQNSYDRLQRLKQAVETVSGYGAPFTRNFSYDNNSNLVTEQNRRGIETVKSYNALNFLTKLVLGGKTVWEATQVNKVGNPQAVKDLYGNQTVYVYDGLQRLREKRLPQNATEILTYDANNNVIDSFDRNGNKTHFTYDAQNRIDTSTDALGRITKWTYDDAAHKETKETISRGLTETTVKDGLERILSQTVSFGGANYQTTYNYNGRDVTMTDPRGTITTVKNSGFGAAGETEVIGANPAHKTTTYYTALGAARQVVDANNRVTNIVNDGLGRKRSISINGEFSESWNYDGEGSPISHTDKRGIVTEMTYDELGRNLTATKGGIEVSKTTYADSTSTETKELAVNAAGSRNSLTMKYDGLRRVKEIANVDGKKKTYTYDGENLLQESDFYDRLTKYEYDALKRVRAVTDRNNRQTRIEYSADDLTKRTTDRRGNLTTESYDALGRVVSVDRYGKLASYTYDGNNNRLTQQDGLNNQTAFEYDKLNRVTKVTHAGGLQTELFTYDAVGNLKTHNDGRGGITEMLEYDALDQVKKAKDGAGNISEFRYDGAGLLLSRKDPKQNVTTYTYNALGSLATITEPGLSPWTLSYDAAQNVTSMTDPLARVTSYEYDAQSRLAQTKQSLGRNTFYEYDDNSKIRKITDPKGQTTDITYTALDSPDTVTYRDSDGAAKLTHRFSYDAEENPWQITENRSGTTQRTYEREYDARNRLTRTTDAYNKRVSFGYDNANNLTTLTDAANRTTSYSYDAKNRLNTVSQLNATIADYDWHTDGLLQKVNYQSGTSRNYVYDDGDRVTSITNNFTNGQSEGFDYSYDANSNRASEIRKSNGRAFRTIAYNYDPLDRLTRADYVSNVEMPDPPIGQTAQYVENTNLNTYAYDAVGNRTSEKTQSQSKTVTLTTTANGTSRSEQTNSSPEQTTTATFNALNELTQLAEPVATSNFTYDLNGNLSEIKKNNAVTNKYEYDVRNQLTKALNGSDAELAKFDYDFERKRISKTSGGVATNYVYAGNQVVSEFQNNQSTANYLIGSGEVVKSEFTNGENNFHFTDALGSVTALANSQGSVTNRSEYDAFGLQASTGATANSIGYTGQRLDNETGLMALGNGERYYSPIYARFIQQDSWLGKNQMPQSLNRFSYGYNNPFKYTDPSGNEPDAVQQGFRDANKYLENNSSGNWYLDFAASFYMRMQQAGYSALKGVYNAGKEAITMVADGLTYMAADAMGIELKDMQFSSKTAQGIQQQRMSGKSAWDIATDTNVLANVATLGVYGTVQSVATNILDLSEGKISMDEYNEKMGELAGEQIFDLLTMGGGKGSGVVRGAEESLSAAKTSIKKMTTGSGEALSNVKRSVKETTKPFEKFSFGELRQKYRSQMKEGLDVKQSRGRIERGEVCFVAGTLIQTKDGEKKIEDIKQGDEVLSYDEQTQAFEYKPVVRTFEKYSEEILSVKIASETESLGVTPEHPFYVRTYGARSNLEGGEDADNQGEWKAAHALEVGDEVLQANGSWSFVESVSVRESGAKVYNFEVSDNHNYFVGEQGTLVHNTCTYSDLDDLERATGALAELDASSLRASGTSKPTVNPVGWVGGAHPTHQQRSHLIADSFGGTGADRRNLVALTDGSNHSGLGMSHFENTIRRHVQAGNSVLYEVRPNYRGSSLVPESVSLYAIDQNLNVLVDAVVPNGLRQNTPCCRVP